jgi:hypothetical protein
MYKPFLICLLQFAHILYLTFLFATPFTNNRLLILFHLISLPLLIWHWQYFNGCILTIWQNQLTGESGAFVYNQFGININQSQWIRIISILAVIDLLLLSILK